MDDEDILVVDDDDDLEIDQDVDEDLDDEDDEELPDETTRTFLIEHGRIRRKVDELPAMVQAVDKILQTERLVYPIYTDQYGNDLNELIGKDMAYAEVEVERMVEEALLADDRITDVQIDTIEQTDNDSLTVTGNFTTVYGQISIDSEVKIAK